MGRAQKEKSSEGLSGLMWTLVHHEVAGARQHSLQAATKTV